MCGCVLGFDSGSTSFEMKLSEALVDVGLYPVHFVLSILKKATYLVV